MKRQTKTKKIGKILFAETLSNFYYPYQNWYFPLKRHCKKIVNFDVRQEYFKYGKEEMNRRFMEKIKKEKPDAVFLWVRSDEYDFDFLLDIRKISPKTRTFVFFGDDDAAFEKHSRYLILFVDYGIVVQKKYLPRYHQDEIKDVFFSIGLDTNFFRQLNIKKKYDVTFIGHPKTKKSDRYRFIKFLKDNGVKIKLFGWGWGNYPEFKDIYGGALTSEEMVKVINESKIHLCFSKNHYGVPHLKGKVFEGGACKTFVLTEYCADYLELFKEGKEIIFFKGKDDLLKKINYYLKNDEKREKIAKEAYNRIIKDYSLDSDLKKIFNQVYFTSKNITHLPLPEVNGKAVCLNKDDLSLSAEAIKSKLMGYDYVSFTEKNSQDLKYKEYLQIRSLEKTGKSISCCDYYVYSRFLGDYLRFVTEKAFSSLNKKDAYSFIVPSQIMMTKEYFLKNIDLVKRIFDGGTIDFMNEENTAIVSLPLLRIRKNINVEYNVAKNSFEFSFLHELYSLKLRKSPYLLIYLLSFFFEIVKGKRFMLSAISDVMGDKDKMRKAESLSL